MRPPVSPSLTVRSWRHTHIVTNTRDPKTSTHKKRPDQPTNREKTCADVNVNASPFCPISLLPPSVKFNRFPLVTTNTVLSFIHLTIQCTPPHHHPPLTRSLLFYTQCSSQLRMPAELKVSQLHSLKWSHSSVSFSISTFFANEGQSVTLRLFRRHYVWVSDAFSKSWPAMVRYYLVVW